MRNLKAILTTTLLLGLVLGLAGCGSDDNPAAVSSDTLTLDSSSAEDFSLQALDMVSGLISDVPTIAAADFGSWSAGKSALAKANTDSVVWSADQNAWVFTYDGPLFEVAAPNYWNISLDLWVQYRNGLEPLQYPLGATEMELHYGSGMDMHMVEDAATSDLAYQMNTAVTVSYLGTDGSYGVVGSGSTVVEMNQTGAEQARRGRFAMDWSLDLTVGSEGCPGGTATVNVQQYQLVAVYTGTGSVNWTLTGPGYQASGTETLACGQPVK